MKFNFKKFFSSFSRKEKIALIVLSAILILSLAGKIVAQTVFQKSGSLASGILSEGILAQSNTEVEKNIKNLTHFGLLYFDENLSIKNGLAESYEISDGGKKYIFHLRDGIDSDNITTALNNYYTSTKNDTFKVNKVDDKTISINLDKVFSPIIYSFTEPIFELGPYYITSQSPETVTLEANDNFVLGKPRIKKIVIKIYQSTDNLEKAFKSQAINSAIGVSEAPRHDQYILNLQKQTVLFFNLGQLQNKEMRKKLRDGKALSSPIELTLATGDSPLLVEKAQEIKKNFDLLGAKTTIRVYPQEEFKDDILPNKSYQMVLLGIDMGRDPDPYPFWHSSQISKEGENFSQFFNKKADRLLEDARMEIDDSKREQKYKEFNNILTEEAPAIFYDNDKLTYLISNRLKGIKINKGITISDRFANVWEWEI